MYFTRLPIWNIFLSWHLGSSCKAESRTNKGHRSLCPGRLSAQAWVQTCTRQSFCWNLSADYSLLFWKEKFQSSLEAKNLRGKKASSSFYFLPQKLTSLCSYITSNISDATDQILTKLEGNDVSPHRHSTWGSNGSDTLQHNTVLLFTQLLSYW